MEALKCPSCGSPDIVNIAEKEYKCENCGTKSQLSKDNTYLVISGIPCPDCGFLNQSDDKFCGNCGKKLIKYCAKCGTETLLDRKYCSNCGNSTFNMEILKSVVLKPGLRGQYQKIYVIKLLRNQFDLDLIEAKNVSDRDTVIASGITNDEALLLKKEYERLGAIVEIKASIIPLDPIIKKYNR